MGRATRDVLLPIAVAVVGLGALATAQSVPNRHSIEDKLTDRSLHALETAGLSDVEVTFVGRDGVVRARSAVDGERAMAIVRRQAGVRAARVQLVAEPSAPGVTVAPAVNLAVDGGRVVVTGTVPSAAIRAALVNAIAAVFGTGAVENRLTVDPRVGDAGLAGLGDVAAALGKDATGAAVDLRGGVITLTGVVATAAAKDAAAQTAARAVGTPSAVLDRLAVVLPPQEVQARLVALPAITFEDGSTTLTAQGQSVVQAAAAILTANPTVNVRVEGHTDTNGSAAANLALSQARAQAVLTALAALGIAPGRMVAAGFGETRPKVPDTTPANQTINRRVDFVVLP